MVLGPLIGAGASLLGGILGANRADDAADQAWDRQKKVLTNQIQWKVQDAVAAGLHPLAGLGVTPAAGPAASVGGEILAGGFEGMGQNLSRAAEAMMTPQDQTSSRMIQLQLERGGLENELLRTQIASQRMSNIQQTTPGVGGGERLKIPMAGGELPVGDPGLGERAERHYSDVGGNLFGTAALIRDVWKYLEMERHLTGDDWTPRINAGIDYLRSKLPPSQPGAKAGYLYKYR